MSKEPKDMSNYELLKEYNYTRNKIDGIIDGGFGKFDLNLLEELVHEMAKREEG